MATTVIEILDCPMPVTVQDMGRPGYRHLGVPLCGALDTELLSIANALLDNPATAAGLEMRVLGPRLRATAALSFALTGDCAAQIENAAGQRRPARPWCSQTLAQGEMLIVGKLHSGVAYLAFGGGLDLPAVLGSRATYARAGIGGLQGRALQAGDRLNVIRRAATPLWRLAQPPQLSNAPLRVLPGPQRDYFSDTAWQRLVGEGFTVNRAADRMGLRLDGPQLPHDPAHGADIVSDAVTPGVIQVPGDGRAIVLLADCQTVGGYPKIACVIGADLPRLGHALPGQTLRFVEVSIEEALAARRQAAAALAHCIAGRVPAERGFDLDALYAANLIDGVIDAQNTH